MPPETKIPQHTQARKTDTPAKLTITSTQPTGSVSRSQLLTQAHCAVHSSHPSYQMPPSTMSLCVLAFRLFTRAPFPIHNTPRTLVLATNEQSNPLSHACHTRPCGQLARLASHRKSTLCPNATPHPTIFLVDDTRSNHGVDPFSAAVAQKTEARMFMVSSEL